MKKETVQNILYSPLYLWLMMHAILPFRVLYLLSDLLYYPLYYMVRYRRVIVRRNLSDSFPEKSEAEITKLEKGFYHHFCDYIVETIKLLHITDDEIRRRAVFKNTEIIDKGAAEGQSFFAMMGHYGNWEWFPSVTLWLKNPDIVTVSIYRTLNNDWFDRLFLRLRGRMGPVCVPKQDTLRAVLGYRKEGRPSVTGLVADQTPSPANIHYWTPFLNHDTAVLTGVEKMAKKLGYKVLYFDMEKTRRGYCQITVRELSDDPKSTGEFEITERYARMMEETILRAPQFWLWTHNRWKHKR